jgi:putative membrane protein (TIGR04086 family)
MRNENFFDEGFSVIKGVAFSLAVSLLGAIVFAVILRGCSLSDEIIYPVNQTMKSVALSLGALLFVRGEKGWLKGLCMGLAFTALSYLAFSAIGGDFSLSWLIFVELALAALVGGIGGVIAVNIRR